MLVVFRDHAGTLVIGITRLAARRSSLFYLMTVFALSWGTTRARLTRASSSCSFSCSAILFFARRRFRSRRLLARARAPHAC